MAEIFGTLFIDKSVERVPSFILDQGIRELEIKHGQIRRIEMSSNLKMLHSEKSGYLSWHPVFDFQSQSIKKSIVRQLPESRARMLLKVKNKHLYHQEFSQQ